MIYNEGTGFTGFMGPPHEYVMIASEHPDSDKPGTLRLSICNINELATVPHWMSLDKVVVSELRAYLEDWEKRNG